MLSDWQGKIIREIQSFSAADSPEFALVNNLYVYPLSVTAKFSNVVISVELREDDADPNLPGLPVVYGSYGKEQFVTTGYTALTPKEKRFVLLYL